MPAKVSRILKYAAPDGTQFDTLAEEQRHELLAQIPDSDHLTSDEVAGCLIVHSAVFIAILSQKERKHADAAKVRKPRKPKATEPAPVV
jgi:hypothetical protein